jgi:protein-serine/threonine kinase
MIPNLTRSSSALGVGTISRAFADAMSRGKGRNNESGLQTPKAEEPAGGGSWLGKPGPGDPVWKEEVAL